jgi:hypothetical protein
VSVSNYLLSNHISGVLAEREMVQTGGTEKYFRSIADGLDHAYGARLHGMINKYFHNTSLRGEWKHMDRKIKATQPKVDGQSKKKKTEKFVKNS